MSKTARLASTQSMKPRHRKDEAAPDTMHVVAAERHARARRKPLRRRQIDPTTCERDYSADELEFMRALESYKKSSGRMFPTCSEILEVFRSLGYERPARPEYAAGAAR